MSDLPPTLQRGAIYHYEPHGQGWSTGALVISIPYLNERGSIVFAEVNKRAYADTHGLLAVQLGEDDPLTGQFVLGWRLNWAGISPWITPLPGHTFVAPALVTERTLDAVMIAVHAAITPVRQRTD